MTSPFEMSDEPRVIAATFHYYRPILGRKMLQLVFEVPLEKQTETLMYLGPPSAAEPKWYAIARLVEQPVYPAEGRVTESQVRR